MARFIIGVYAQVDGRLAGDSLELSALKGSGWTYDGNRSVALPPAASGAGGEGLRILVRHPFSAALQVTVWFWFVWDWNGV